MPSGGSPAGGDRANLRRRSEARFRRRLRVTYDLAGTSRVAFTTDVSRHGLSVGTPAGPVRQEQVSMVVELPSGAQVALHAIVVWCRHVPALASGAVRPGFAVRLKEPVPQTWADFVHDLQVASGRP